MPPIQNKRAPAIKWKDHVVSETSYGERPFGLPLTIVVADLPTDAYTKLRDGVAWKQEQVTVFGKMHDMPRRTYSCGERGATYTYSGNKNTATGWDDGIDGFIRELRDICVAAVGLDPHDYNYALLNYYVDGKHNIGWHADDESRLVKGTAIVSVSLGATRDFRLKPMVAGEQQPRQIVCRHGTIIAMLNGCQQMFKHCVPATKSVTDGRINITFRCVK